MLEGQGKVHECIFWLHLFAFMLSLLLLDMSTRVQRSIQSAIAFHEALKRNLDLDNQVLGRPGKLHKSHMFLLTILSCAQCVW